MKIRGTEGPKRIQMTEKFNGLKFTAKLEFEDITDSEIIGRRQGDGLKSCVVQIGIGGSEAAYRQSHCRTGAICQLVRIAGAYHRSGQTIAISHIAAER